MSSTSRFAFRGFVLFRLAQWEAVLLAGLLQVVYCVFSGRTDSVYLQCGLTLRASTTGQRITNT